MIHDRSATPLTGSRQPLLGLARFPYSDARFQLPAGSTILAYTDGLIERRDRSYRIGESGLRSVLGAMPDNDPMAALESVINSVVGEDRDDDLAVIAVAADGRNRAQTLARRRVRMVWTMPDLSLATARARLRQWLEYRTSRPSVDAVELVVTELLTNGRDASAEGGLVELEVLKGEEWIEVTVSNSGDVFVPSDAMPDENALRGRGLAMVEAVSHTVSVERRMGRTVVTAWIAQQP
jgi:anti-sigma regulatory factor (Ser/Thr protein kinase)